MTTVFLDTSALLPLLNSADADHDAVDRAVRELAGEHARLVTTSYVAVEAGALTRHRLGPKAFRALGEVLERSVEITWVDRDLHTRAWELVGKETRRGPGLVDWVSFLVMRERGIDTALALDAHFSKQGFTTLP